MSGKLLKWHWQSKKCLGAQHQQPTSHGRCRGHPLTSNRGKHSIPHNQCYIATFATKGIFTVLAHDDTHENLQNFVDVCWPLLFINISQELVWLRPFPFSLKGEDCKWLPKSPRNSITSWDFKFDDNSA